MRAFPEYDVVNLTTKADRCTITIRAKTKCGDTVRAKVTVRERPPVAATQLEKAARNRAEAELRDANRDAVRKCERKNREKHWKEHTG